MRRHAVRATVAVAALSLAVLSSPIQAQDKPSAQELVSDPVKGALLLLPSPPRIPPSQLRLVE